MKTWKFYTNGPQIWQGMLEDIRLARTSIELEQFSFHADRTGKRFLTLLEEKAKQGVRIRLVCDAVASSQLFASSAPARLRKAGVQILAYNEPDIFHPNLWLKRTHKKTMVVDSEIAWVGGLGIKDKFKAFRDTQVRATGPLVQDVQKSFEDIWHYLQQPGRVLNERDFEPDPESGLQLLINYPNFGKKQIYEWIRNAISKAEKRIYLSTAYFYPDRNFFQLLLDKAKSGVDVRIILRGKDDEFVTVRFATSFFDSSIVNGIKIYRYLPNIMHAKTAIIDDQATVGSCNLDKFSFYHNLEVNIASSNPEFVKELEQHFFEDLKSCKQIIREEWQRRPVRERVLEILLWPFHNYL